MMMVAVEASPADGHGLSTRFQSNLNEFFKSNNRLFILVNFSSRCSCAGGLLGSFAAVFYDFNWTGC